jgi:hypothetical protein
MTLAPLTIDDTERMAELVETYASVGDRALAAGVQPPAPFKMPGLYGDGGSMPPLRTN